MANQFDLFGAIAPTPPSPAAAAPAPDAKPPHLQEAYPWPNAHLRPARPLNPLAGASAESLAAMAAIVLIDELPVVPDRFPRVTVDRAGWDRAMEHRRILAMRQMGGTISPADAEALAALQFISLQQSDYAVTGPVIITAHGLEHLQQALAGFCCATQGQVDG